MSPSPTHARLGWALALATTLAIVPSVIDRHVPNTWLVGDGGFYLNMEKSLTQSGSLNQSHIHPHSWYDSQETLDDAFSNISLGSSGEWWPKHSYLMPVAALPFYWLFGVEGTLVFNVTMMVLMVLLGYHLARQLAPDGIAAAAALVTALTGPYVAYAYNFSNDGFYSVLVLAALLATMRDRFGLGGFLLGLAVWAKITCVLLAPAFLGVLVWRLQGPHDRQPLRQRLRPLIRFCLFGAIPLLMYAAANAYMFGAPWITSYQRVLVVKGGVLGTASHTSLFTTPFFEGLKDVFADGKRGLLTGYPIVVLSWLGLIPLLLARKTRPLALGLLATTLLVIAFFARFKYYQERFLFPVFGMMIMPAAAFVDRSLSLLDRLRPTPRAKLIALVGLAALVGGWRIADTLQRRATYTLSDHIQDAHVTLGGTHCDYFNNMRWSWECMGQDSGDAEYIGVNAAQKHPFGDDEAANYIFIRGHHSRKPRAVTWANVPLKDTLVFRYGLDDQSRPPADTTVVLHLGQEELLSDTITKKGELYEARFDTRALSGTRQDITVTVTTRHRGHSRLVINGWIR